MIEMTFTPEMRAILGKMKGKTFKSYECDLSQRWHRTVAALRINLGRYAVDLTCINQSVANWDVELDDPTVFACAERGLKDPFFPDDPVPSHVYMVNEVITGVEVVNDTVSVNGDPIASIDIALVVRTRHKTYTFARNIWFDYAIDVNVSDEVVIPYSAEECADDWSDSAGEGGDVAAVTRVSIQL